ncbi:Mth938-like domain-containing protein [Hansschlegelia plantiphila]|uniref:Membrane protein n=1 Tax=Hansschlegelia plantiphila TaxID=374655 RepID=A0A9W6J187_9HYPH|nr:MTH938/NDUFAF3 family protein [Hansschlegelia plantiphila]GLK67538.1 membrane protein [Hansschlegelia plantiphila]
MSNGDERHLPGRHLIDAYGGGGFRLAGLSHRGSLLGLPSGMWAWPYREPLQLTDAAFERVVSEAAEIDTLLVGTGEDVAPLRRAVREALQAHGVVVEAMATGAAARTWNVMVGEGRRVAAALLAVR